MANAAILGANVSSELLEDSSADNTAPEDSSASGSNPGVVHDVNTSNHATIEAGMRNNVATVTPVIIDAGPGIDMSSSSEARVAVLEHATLETITPGGVSQTPTFKDFNVDDLHPVTVPCGSHAMIPLCFGQNGTLVTINQYGCILNISKALLAAPRAELEANINTRRYISLDSSEFGWVSRTGMERRQGLLNFAHTKHYGFGPCLDSGKAVKNLKLSWVKDRWPLIKYSVKDINVSIQFAITPDGTLLQQCLIESELEEARASPLVLRLRELLISVNPSDDDDIYTPSLVPNNCPMLYDEENNLVHIKHTGQALSVQESKTKSESNSETDTESNDDDEYGDDDNGDAAEAIMYVFEDGQIVNLNLTTSRKSLPMKVDASGILAREVFRNIDDSGQVSPGRLHEVTVAYKLQYTGEAEISTMDYVDIGSLLKSDMPAIALSGDASHKFNAVFRRHLEHILCVCAVPVMGLPPKEKPLVFINGGLSYPATAPPISAFFMFRYLLLVYQLLESEGIPDPITRERIKSTCKKHLTWCFDKQNFFDVAPLAFGARKPSPEESGDHTNFFAGSLQIIKLFEYTRVFKGEDAFVLECLKECGATWIRGLKTEQDEKSKLWYQRNNTPTYISWEGSGGKPPEWLSIPSFRLGDSIYVWKAMKSLQELIIGVEGGEKISYILDEVQNVKLGHTALRRLILQRFICKVQSRPETHTELKYALAVSRSGSREGDRFLFYAKDTVLYDALCWGFFSNDSDIDVKSAWKETLRNQGTDAEAIWKTPLRYGLAIVLERSMKEVNSSLDSRYPPRFLADIARERLKECLLPSGLIAERIDWETKEPNLKTDYCQSRSTYEIPTLLLRKDFGLSRSKIFAKEETTKSLDHKAPVPAISDILLEDEDQKKRRIAREKKDIAFQKKKQTSNAKIDQTKVYDPRERQERDWLHPYPDFIHSQPAYRNMATEISSLREEIYHSVNGKIEENPLKVLEEGMTSWEERRKFNWGPISCLLVDIGRHGRNNPLRQLCDPWDLDRRLYRPRTVDQAKKRFHYLSPLSSQQALVLYLANPKRDQYDLAQFLSRHQKFTAHMHEDVHHISNVWTTELHLSFIQLVPANNSDRDYLKPRFPIVCDGFLGKSPLRVSNKRMNTFKASLGYRLVGDMDDRYWTGWLLAYSPESSSSWPRLKTDDEAWFQPSIHQDQRKILEPYLVQMMAAEVGASTDKILLAVDEWLDLKSSMNSGFDRLYTRAKRCLDIDGLLNRICRLSVANRNNLNQWLKRDTQRGVRPRWSEKDELKHGSWRDQQNLRVAKQISLLNEQAKRIEASIKLVKNHRLVLVDNLNLAESRTAARSGENVRIFTYATVVFLPLSFVSSLFSMGGIPSEEVVSIFIRATAIALVVTFVIVFNAASLAWPLQLLRFKMRESALKRMRKTVNTWPFGWKNAVKIISKLEDDGMLHADEAPKWQGNKMVYVLFWIVYIIIEVPSIRVVSGYRSLIGKSDPIDSLDLILGRIVLGLVFLPAIFVTWPILLAWNLISIGFSGAYHKMKRSWAKTKGVAQARRVWAQWPDQSIDENMNEDDKRKLDPKKTLGPTSREKAEAAARRANRHQQNKLEENVSLLLNPLALPEYVKQVLRQRKEQKREERRVLARELPQDVQDDTGPEAEHGVDNEDEDDDDDNVKAGKDSEVERIYRMAYEERLEKEKKKRHERQEKARLVKEKERVEAGEWPRKWEPEDAQSAVGTGRRESSFWSGIITRRRNRSTPSPDNETAERGEAGKTPHATFQESEHDD